ncbi:Glutathione S-transferase protein [Niveomyces insectorum RCEF 264]|uniref:glutathione transferase n=1 Tax=Niveomyces insectorum RCEF 264 TaxID=1081102 RepID=A0A167XS42_9HYPO|nr:Glutathione S-transferase protein [Niveomyces insectorum RCEF 264]
MSIKPLTLYGHANGPNPWKVAMLIEELNVPFTHKLLQFPELKQQPYVSINPNGRVPAIEDPNTGITLWESGAIIEYLVETYDKEHKISFAPGTKEFYEAKQWLFYQASGQGPYFGQAAWFSFFHADKIPSAIDRYINEIRRVSGVLDGFLKDKEYLVGGKYSYADASFVPWYGVVKSFADKIDLEKDFPHLHAWLERIQARPAIAKVQKEQAEAGKAH